MIWLQQLSSIALHVSRGPGQDQRANKSIKGFLSSCAYWQRANSRCFLVRHKPAANNRICEQSVWPLGRDLNYQDCHNNPRDKQTGNTERSRQHRVPIRSEKVNVPETQYRLATKNQSVLLDAVRHPRKTVFYSQARDIANKKGVPKVVKSRPCDPCSAIAPTARMRYVALVQWIIIVWRCCLA